LVDSAGARASPSPGPGRGRVGPARSRRDRRRDGVRGAAHDDDASRIDRLDAILVLGAAQYGGDPSPVFQGRLEHASLLYEQARAPIVIVLGGERPGDRTTEAEAGRAFLVEQEGLPPDAVAAVPVGNTTLESLQAAATYLHERGLRSAFLVSDPWHNLRIERMASDVGIDGHASATWTSAAKTEQTRFEGYVRETFAYLYYRIVGR
jgi:uncharacterized SAM-binding protein YcdF (DUF218 family)